MGILKNVSVLSRWVSPEKLKKKNFMTCFYRRLHPWIQVFSQIKTPCLQLEWALASGTSHSKGGTPHIFHPGNVKFGLTDSDFVVGEVPIRVGSPDGGSHQGGSLRAFPTDGEHTSMGISTYLTISSLSFLHSFFLVFLNFSDLSLASLCFWIFMIHPITKSFHGNMGT